VTVTAVHEASGNTFVGVTDDRGMFRLPVRTGLHRLTLELAGFGTVNRSIDPDRGKGIPPNPFPLAPE
jgi:hypothetical protein